MSERERRKAIHCACTRAHVFSVPTAAKTLGDLYIFHKHPAEYSACVGSNTVRYVGPCSYARQQHWCAYTYPHWTSASSGENSNRRSVLFALGARIISTLAGWLGVGGETRVGGWMERVWSDCAQHPQHHIYWNTYTLCRVCALFARHKHHLDDGSVTHPVGAKECVVGRVCRMCGWVGRLHYTAARAAETSCLLLMACTCEACTCDSTR